MLQSVLVTMGRGWSSVLQSVMVAMGCGCLLCCMQSVMVTMGCGWSMLQSVWLLRGVVFVLQSAI